LSVSDTTIGNRLESLERIGLVDRSTAPPPAPRHTNITLKGIEVIEIAIADAYHALHQVMDAKRASLAGATALQSNDPSKEQDHDL